MTSSTRLVLFLTLIGFWVSQTSGNEDVRSLIALKQSLWDPDHNLDSWDPNLVDPCTWFYITCNDDNRVTRVDLLGLNLGGVISPEIGNLDTLQYLELYRNSIQGVIPPELGKLESLRSLDLYNNSITGTIPPALGNLKELLFLRLHDNPLSGTIPPEVSSLPKLRVLDVTNTRIVNPPPKEQVLNNNMDFTLFWHSEQRSA